MPSDAADIDRSGYRHAFPAGRLPGGASDDPLREPDALDVRLQRPIDIELSDAPTEDVLTLLAEAGDVDIFIAGDFDMAVTSSLRAATIEAALDEVTRLAGAVWRPIPTIRIVPGIGETVTGSLDGEPITMELRDTALRDLAAPFSSLLGMPIAVGRDVPPVVVSASLADVPAGDAFVELLRSVSLGYVVADGVEVRLARDVDETW